MPIKYNLTKYDMLAEKIHDLASKKDTFSKDEEALRAEATLIASFASSHSWQTYKLMTEGNANAILSSPEIKSEHLLARNDKWKHIKNMDIQQVACTNINGMFFIWLTSINVDKNSRDAYRYAWAKLKSDLFEEECDGGISMQKQR
jgi:hypothetical protein